MSWRAPSGVTTVSTGTSGLDEPGFIMMQTASGHVFENPVRSSGVFRLSTISRTLRQSTDRPEAKVME
jgi:hypothetical protein